MNAAVQFSQYDLAPGGMIDGPWPDKLGAEIDDAGQSSLRTPRLRDPRRIVYTVLQRQDTRGSAHERC